MDSKTRSILTEDALPKLTDFADQVVTIHGIEGWYRSGYGEYAKMRLRESLDLLTVGNKSVLPKLRKLEDHGEFPVTVLVKSFKTKFGTTGIDIVPADEDDGKGESYVDIDDPRESYVPIHDPEV